MTKSLGTINWLKDFSQYNRLYVGYSGGLDSTVLLHLLASQTELLPTIIAVHVNHGLSINADQWQHHCEKFCASNQIPCISRQVSIVPDANIEARAREARYKVFDFLLGENDCLLLAHHQNDQAETVLLQLFRGAGIDGLAAMPVIKTITQSYLARPLLNYSRQQLVDYASIHNLYWIDDESNINNSFSRNFLRNEIIPLLENRWPGVVANLARTALHCQQSQDLLEQLANIDQPQGFTQQLDLKSLQNLGFSRIQNILRIWLKKNNVRMPGTVIFNRIFNEVIVADADAEPEVAWSNYRIRRYQHVLHLSIGQLEKPVNMQWNKFPNNLYLGDNGHFLQAMPSEKGVRILPTSKIDVCYRQGGEEIVWHGQTKSLKKLFQEWRIPVWQRDCIPLIYVDGELAVITSYAIGDLFYAEGGGDVYQISKEPSSVTA